MIAATTLCGRISPAIMGGRQDRDFLEDMRFKTGASLMGAGTLRRGDPEMRGPGGDLLGKRIRAIITGSGDLPRDGRKLFSFLPKPFIFTKYSAVEELKTKMADRAAVIGVGSAGGQLEIRQVLNELGNLGVESVLIEGGAILNYSCLEQGVVDEIYLTLTPHLSGDTSAASLAAGAGPLGKPFMGLELLECRPNTDGEIFLRYKVIAPADKPLKEIEREIG